MRVNAYNDFNVQLVISLTLIKHVHLYTKTYNIKHKTRPVPSPSVFSSPVPSRPAVHRPALADTISRINHAATEVTQNIRLGTLPTAVASRETAQQYDIDPTRPLSDCPSWRPLKGISRRFIRADPWHGDMTRICSSARRRNAIRLKGQAMPNRRRMNTNKITPGARGAA